MAAACLHVFLGRSFRNHRNPTILLSRYHLLNPSPAKWICFLMVLRFVKDLRVGGPGAASLHFTNRPWREDRGLQCQNVETDRVATLCQILANQISLGAAAATAGSSQDITKTLPGVEVSLKRCCVHVTRCKPVSQDGKQQGKAWETVQFQ